MRTLQENQSLNAEYERNKKEREMKEEIERLNNIIKGLDNTIENLEEVVEHKDNIIKEVREYIEEHTYKLKTTRVPKIDFSYKELLEILEKVGEE